MSMDEMRDEIESRVFPSVGCEIVLAIRPARLQTIAERLDPALPAEWEVISTFHRELDNGRELFFHRIETYNDRVSVPVLLEFADRYAEIDEQINIEMAKQDAPEEFDKAVESLGRERAIEMFAGLAGSGANLVQLRSVTEENLSDAGSEVLLRVDLGVRLDDAEVTGIMGQEFMGKLIRVEKVGPSEYLMGGELVSNVEQVRETVGKLEEMFDVSRENSAIVCESVR